MFVYGLWEICLGAVLNFKTVTWVVPLGREICVDAWDPLLVVDAAILLLNVSDGLDVKSPFEPNLVQHNLMPVGPFLLSLYTLSSVPDLLAMGPSYAVIRTSSTYVFDRVPRTSHWCDSNSICIRRQQWELCSNVHGTLTP